jgi:predicted metal-dependent enzyme (double-stranded beta helix superfamily)
MTDVATRPAYTNELIGEDAEVIRNLIGEVRAAFETETTSGRVIAATRAALMKSLADAACLDGLQIDRDEFRSHKLWVDPDHLFALFVGHHKPSHRRVPHDHGELGWAVYGILEGQAKQQLFERLDDGSQPGRAELRALPLIEQRAGDATIIPVGGIHFPIGEAEYRSLVIRSRDQTIIWRNVYDAEAGTVKKMRGSE